MKKNKPESHEAIDCWQAMCSTCPGGWYGQHQPNSALANANAATHNNAKHHGDQSCASAVHSCAFPPSNTI